MNIAITLNDVATVAAIICGVAALVLGLCNYFRDSPKVCVKLTWDMTEYAAGSANQKGKNTGLIVVTNVGRRPVYLSHAALRLPAGYDNSHLLLKEGLFGKKVAEGDPPFHFQVDQEQAKPYASKWRDVRAEITDSTGRVWVSKTLNRKPVPSWAARG